MAENHDNQASDIVNVPFTAVNAGQQSGSLINGLLAVNGGNIQLAGEPPLPLPSVIQGIDSISITPTTGLYAFQINVFGASPALGELVLLTFQDQTGDTYRLSIVSPFAINHTVDYNSDSPNITLVAWTIQAIANETTPAQTGVKD